jgi:hypothetical protein
MSKQITTIPITTIPARQNQDEKRLKLLPIVVSGIRVDNREEVSD